MLQSIKLGQNDQTKQETCNEYNYYAGIFLLYSGSIARHKTNELSKVRNKTRFQTNNIYTQETFRRGITSST